MDHPNSVHPIINLMMEVEIVGALLFLGVLVHKKLNSSLVHSTYRKLKHMNQYFHHGTSHLLLVQNTLMNVWHNRWTCIWKSLPTSNEKQICFCLQCFCLQCFVFNAFAFNAFIFNAFVFKLPEKVCLLLHSAKGELK